LRSSGAAACAALAATLALAEPAPAEVYASQKEALAQAFPEADRIEKTAVALDDAQAALVERLSQAPLESRLAAIHAAWRADERLGYAVIDVHAVRTLSEALLVVLAPDGAVRSVRLLAFHEPPEYRPRESWYQQFAGATPDAPPRVHAIAGATLSSRAAQRSVRRALALWRVLAAPKGAE
jgi:Na+-translocating ferredoxin:NAD+ oxidoreductase RnfG subunit